MNSCANNAAGSDGFMLPFLSGIDSDTALVLMLLFVLYKQGADRTLLLALVMILL